MLPLLPPLLLFYIISMSFVQKISGSWVVFCRQSLVFRPFYSPPPLLPFCSLMPPPHGGCRKTCPTLAKFIIQGHPHKGKDWKDYLDLFKYSNPKCLKLLISWFSKERKIIISDVSFYLSSEMTFSIHGSASRVTPVIIQNGKKLTPKIYTVKP